ncbi:hypothetical protein B296_00033246 [Ensete ventricosum]|uniref:TPM domain-containing protein n=1 Tax=Ensete ventricosum TaxID=4639 RepID=A0A427ABH5_ENSVE|nr:hypothetical protein B296_00033246 [Ensete ventricosum]
METIISSCSSAPLLLPKPSSHHPRLPLLSKPISCTLKNSSPAPSPHNRSWISHLHHGLATAALSLAINFCPVPSLDPPALASEFDVLKEGPPAEYVVDDAGVLSRVTKSDLKSLMSDLEKRKNVHINFITLRKLTVSRSNFLFPDDSNPILLGLQSKADAFEYADQVLEKWYPTIEDGNNKGVVVLVTTQKEGAITGGPAFIQAVGDTILDATVSENLPGLWSIYITIDVYFCLAVLATDEKYNEAIVSTAKRLVAAIDGLPDPGGPMLKDNKRESNFKSKEETEEKRGQFTLVVVGLLVIAFVVPMAQYYAYVSKK